MKSKVILLATLVTLIGATTLKAQLNVGGTTAPVTTLDVQGNSYINGNLGIGLSVPNAQLQLGNTVVNRKIVLYDGFNNQHQFFGFGVNANVLRYQVDAVSTDHVFYAATSANTSTELMRIKGIGNVGIGVTVPAAKLDIAGNIKITDGTQGTGKVLTSDANGLATWATAGASISDLRFLGTNNHLTQDAGVGSNGTSLGSGTGNVAIANNSLKLNTTGANNVAVGESALGSNTTGGQNVSVGTNSMSGNTTGGYNVGLGYSTLSGGLSSNDNVAVGTAAGANITAGGRNTAIGVNTNIANPTASNQLNISNAIFGTGLSGSVTAPAGNIGIGTNAPTSKFTVNGAATNLSAYNAAASTTIDFSLSNLAYTTASAGAFTLSNLLDGGTYTLAVKGATSGTSSFTASGFTVHLPVDNSATIAGKHTVYTFLVIGSDVYMSWITGL